MTQNSIVIESACRLVMSFPTWIADGRTHVPGTAAFLLRAVHDASAKEHAAGALQALVSRAGAQLTTEPGFLAGLASALDATMESDPSGNACTLLVQAGMRVIHHLPAPAGLEACRSFLGPVVARLDPARACHPRVRSIALQCVSSAMTLAVLPIVPSGVDPRLAVVELARWLWPPTLALVRDPAHARIGDITAAFCEVVTSILRSGGSALGDTARVVRCSMECARWGSEEPT